MTKTRHTTLLLVIVLVTSGLIYATLPKRSIVKATTPQKINILPAAAKVEGTGESNGPRELKSLESQLQQKPDHTPILFRQAQIYREMGKLTEAVRLLRQIVGNEPKNWEARLELGRALYELGDVQGAMLETNAILKDNPKNTDALYNLGAIYGNLNNQTLAREYWNRTVASDPYSASAGLARQALNRLGPSSP